MGILGNEQIGVDIIEDEITQCRETGKTPWNECPVTFAPGRDHGTTLKVF